MCHGLGYALCLFVVLAFVVGWVFYLLCTGFAAYVLIVVVAKTTEHFTRRNQ